MIRIISILLCIWFVSMGAPKLFGLSWWTVQFDQWGYPRSLMLIVGAVETLGGVLLLFRRTAVFAAAALVVIMIGAGYTHASHFEGQHVIKPTLTAAALVWVILKRRQAPNFKKTAASKR